MSNPKVFKQRAAAKDSVSYGSRSTKLEAYADYSTDWGWTATVLYRNEILDCLVAKDREHAIEWIAAWDRRKQLRERKPK